MKFRVVVAENCAVVLEADKVTFLGTGGIKFEAQAGGFVAAWAPDEWVSVVNFEEVPED